MMATYKGLLTRLSTLPRFRLLGISTALMAGLGIFLVLLLCPAHIFTAGQPKEKDPPKVKAPGLDGGVAWLNTKEPIKLEDLKGRVVLLDFWTLCCINCIHTLPDLARLETKYGGSLVVIGVHSPKFPNEEKTESIRKAVLRYQIKHPVINDAKHAIWRRYQVRAWPTLVLIDPEGNFVGYTSGEGRYDVLDKYIGELVTEYKKKGTLKTKLLPFQLERRKESAAKHPLYFPGKILADAKHDRLYIADSTHHRIVITDLAGKLIETVGTGLEGKKDGSFDEASFSDPQGMARVGNILYVADRKNHMIRALDLKKKTVKVAAGTGKQDRFGRFAQGDALKTGLNSPWDLLYHQGKLFIAMAGHHQIWTFNLTTNEVSPYAGNGRENIADGTLMDESEFAQPSGLATDGKTLYVADSETSSIRAVPMNGKGKVETLVGSGLFVYGDKDGTGKEVRLQHALGVAYKNGLLYVADTYNSKIKTLDPKTKECKTFSLKEMGKKSKLPILGEPGGISFAGDKLYVADTNNHRIRVIDMKSHVVSTVGIEALTPPEVLAKATEKERE